MRVFARNGGKDALTEFRVQENFGEFALVEGCPQTNRRHQVRAHLAAAGAPVLNDILYGDSRKQLLLSDIKRGYKGGAKERPMIRSLALHLGELTVTHPISREKISFSAPLPMEFEIALKNLRKFGSGRLTHQISRLRVAGIEAQRFLKMLQRHASLTSRKGVELCEPVVCFRHVGIDS